MAEPHARQPSDLYAALTWERLQILAKLLWDTRTWVAENATPERGDRACGIGYRCWEQSTHAVTCAAATQYSEWLSVADGGAHFILKIAAMPIRFCRADADTSLPENYSFAEPTEKVMIELALGASFSGILRMVVEADNRGFPLGVHLVHAHEGGRHIMAWRIPVDDSGTDTIPIAPPILPVDLPPLEVKSVAEVETEEAAQAEEDAARRLRLVRDDNTKGA